MLAEGGHRPDQNENKAKSLQRTDKHPPKPHFSVERREPLPCTLLASVESHYPSRRVNRQWTFRCHRGRPSARPSRAQACGKRERRRVHAAAAAAAAAPALGDPPARAVGAQKTRGDGWALRRCAGLWAGVTPGSERHPQPRRDLVPPFQWE